MFLPLLVVVPLYWLTLGREVGSADTFEFQVVVPQLGIAHPTGYPLYLLLGKIWTLLPVGVNAAMRLNVGTMVYGVLGLVVVVLLGGWGWGGGDRPTRSGQLIAAGAGAVVFGLTPTFWSQAVEAEVYTLHLLIVAGVLWLCWRLTAGGERESGRTITWIVFLLCLGVTNYLTTVLLVPVVGVAVLLRWRGRGTRTRADESGRGRFWWMMPAPYSLLPLLLYVYLPVRWRAVNGEGMGFGRFLDWITAREFSGSLRLDGWLDWGRWEVIGRIYLDNFGAINLAVIVVGLLLAWWRNWRLALLLTITWFVFTFYGVNYFVADVRVFVLPAMMVMGVLWGLGVGGWGLGKGATAFFALLLLVPTAWRTPDVYAQVDASERNGRLMWGRAALAEELEEGATILADSVNYPPLYYLQQAEGVRPDLDIKLLPNEAAYRAELDQLVANGGPVYLARYLPNLPYKMGSVGGLVRVSQRPLIATVEGGGGGQSGDEILFRSNGIELIAAELEHSDYAKNAVNLKLTWRLARPVTRPLVVYLRWEDEETQPIERRQPVDGLYPFAAWQVGEEVNDFYLLSVPIRPNASVERLQLALAPPFTSVSGLNWQTVDRLAVDVDSAETATTLRRTVGDHYLTGITVPQTVRPNEEAVVTVTGVGPVDGLEFVLLDIDGFIISRTGEVERDSDLAEPFAWRFALPVGGENLRVSLALRDESGQCRTVSPFCVVGSFLVDGVPLPPRTVNFDDKIGLLDAAVDGNLIADGKIDVRLRWLALAEMEADYTVFVQVVDGQDRIVAQTDQFPVQGTRPTSGWRSAEEIVDRVEVFRSADVELDASADYRVLIGLYELETGQRLPVVNREGEVIEDRFVLPLR